MLNKMLLFTVNVGYKETKISKGHTLAYLTPAQCYSLSETGESNNERVITNIWLLSQELISIYYWLLAINKMIFSEEHMSLRKVVLQDAEILADPQGKLNCLLHVFDDTISSSPNDAGYTKLIEMEI